MAHNTFSFVLLSQDCFGCLEVYVVPNKFWASLVAQIVTSPLAVQETWVRPLSQADPLEKGMANCSSVPGWRIPWIEEAGRLQSLESQSRTRPSN